MYLVQCSLSVVEIMSRAFWRLTFLHLLGEKQEKRERMYSGLLIKTVPCNWTPRHCKHSHS